MKRTGPCVVLIEDIVETGFHFIGGLIGEGQSDDLMRGYTLRNHMGDPVDNHPRFTTTRACQN